MPCKTSRIVKTLLAVICFSLLSLSSSEISSAFTPLTSTSIGRANVNKNAVSEQSPISIAQGDEHEEMSGKSEISLFSKNILAKLQLLLEDFTLRAYWRISILNINKHRLLYDVKIAVTELLPLSGFSTFLEMLGSLGLVFLLAALLEWIFRTTLLRKHLRRPAACPLTITNRLWLALTYVAPKFVSLFFFIGASYIFYVLFYSTYFSVICPFYLSSLVTIAVIRFSSLVFAFILAPYNESIRLINWDDEIAKVVYRSALLFMSILTAGMMTTILLKYGGLDGDSLLWVKLLFGTSLIVVAGMVVFHDRKIIYNWVLGNYRADTSYQESGHKFSSTWLFLLFLYLLIFWLIWFGKLILSESHFTLAFTASLMILPIFLLFDSLLASLFRFVLQALSSHDELAEENDKAQHDVESGVFASYLSTLSRLMLISFLLLWIMSLWGVHFSYTPVIISSMKKITVLFIIFFILWQLIDMFIARLLRQKEELPQEEDQSGESEWGEGQLLDRSQTLLPIVRKFLGIVMIVLLVLFTLSSSGVDIGPLLAGAGVMGIAIGFGSQKLVNDLLSGFFYLVDDAFRVGEYIEAGAGSISGTVEKITLRNIMLRHHRGMLQIIPYSDLSSITNYMRGGIVVKFNLQFPYDTDVDLVRKIIKKVGIKMLDDPEYGSNFIKQLKSQGIREVGDSVLTIRAKFTAKPGTHFVIKREAYRRIAEALNDKDIHYAHRKVIVDFPESVNPETITQETKKQILRAGAAATIAKTDDQNGV